MKKIGIIVNREKDADLSFTESIGNWLDSHGCTAEILDGEIIKPGASYDFLICLGGDGTILHAAGKSALYDIPLLGINLGNVGYLTDANKSEAFKSLERVLNGEFALEKRMMLNADLTAYGRSKINPALNEIHLSRGTSNMIRIKVWINDDYIDAYRCDGILISTPTGSTAYNLSAGGPILKPDGNMIAITPVCPHALYTRPFVVSADDAVKIQIIESGMSDVILHTDGINIIELKSNDSVTITRSEYRATIIKTNNYGFYDILRRKILRAGGGV